jgi:hypothetical protein
MDRYLYIFETLVNLSSYYGAGMLDILSELFFTVDPL